MYGMGNDPLAALQKQLDQMRAQVQMGQAAQSPHIEEPSSNIVWVQGIEGAKGYQVPKRANILMLDSDNEGIMYIVSSDEVGMRKMRKFRFEEEEIKQPGDIDMDKYATKEDVRNIILEMFGEKGADDDQVISGPCYVKE